MNVNEAYEKALAHFRRNGETRIGIVLDAQTHWIFCPGDPNVIVYGGEGVKIDKQSGELDRFFLPNSENFALLDRAVRIDVPQ